MEPSQGLKRAAAEALQEGRSGFYYGKIYYVIAKILPNNQILPFFVLGDYCVFMAIDSQLG